MPQAPKIDPVDDKIDATTGAAPVPAHVAIIMDGNGRWAAAPVVASILSSTGSILGACGIARPFRPS